MNPKRIGKLIKTLRENLELTQEQLAKRAGVNHSYISLLETGQRMPTVKTADKLCAALGIKLADLFREE
jgi:transcriptional regulator with XRE-family HTH domain